MINSDLSPKFVSPFETVVSNRGITVSNRETVVPSRETRVPTWWDKSFNSMRLLSHQVGTAVSLRETYNGTLS